VQHWTPRHNEKLYVDRLENVLELGGGGLHSDDVDIHIDIRLVKMDALGFECEIEGDGTRGSG
jgi:hypothetical protein